MLPTPEEEVRTAVDAFFAALRSEDKTALATMMIPEAVIIIHDHMDGPKGDVRIVPVSAFLEGHETRAVAVDEVMTIETVLVTGTMAQAWGPYTFRADGKVTHCGVNSLSLVNTEAGWRVGNTSFTMVPPNECANIGAPEFPE